MQQCADRVYFQNGSDWQTNLTPGHLFERLWGLGQYQYVAIQRGRPDRCGEEHCVWPRNADDLLANQSPSAVIMETYDFMVSVRPQGLCPMHARSHNSNNNSKNK